MSRDHRGLARVAVPLLPVLTSVSAPRRRDHESGAVLQWLFLLGVFVVTLEITCRLEDWIRFRTPLLSPFLSQADLMVSDGSGIHGRPLARFQKWVMNGLGMRGPEASLLKPPATIRVVTVGASETFGLYESSRREFPRQLEDTLNAWRKSRQCRGTAPPHFEVLNAALPGMSLPTVEQDLRSRVRHLGADVVVLYPTPAQYLDDEPPHEARPGQSSELSVLRSLYPRMVARMRSQAKEVLPDVAKTWLRRRETEAYVREKPPGWRFTQVPPDRMRLYEKDLRAFIGTVRAMSAVPVIATHANAFMRDGFQDPNLLAAWEKFYPRAPGTVIVAFDSVAREVTLQAAADSAAIVVDVARSLSQAPGPIFSDFSHFTDLGAARAAASLSPAVFAGTRPAGLCAGGGTEAARE